LCAVFVQELGRGAGRAAGDLVEGAGRVVVLAGEARSMLAGDFSPAFALKHALKDAELAAQAAQASGTTLTLTSALLPRWRDTAASGHADDDLSAVYLTS
jgi:3-hydroxyisobutyrate dehydrogenase-like beta-hydroxyacid dehydrogenase